MDHRAVILAGGKGSRLGPYTTVLPKPLLPIGDRAILDVVVRQLSEAGFGRVTLAVGYLAHLVRAGLLRFAGCQVIDDHAALLWLDQRQPAGRKKFGGSRNFGLDLLGERRPILVSDI